MNHRRLWSLTLIACAMLTLGWAGAARALDLQPPSETTAYTADKTESRAPSRCRTTARCRRAPLSFTDNGDGAITDNNTGLMWEKKSDDGGLHDKDGATPGPAPAATTRSGTGWTTSTPKAAPEARATTTGACRTRRSFQGLVNYENPSPTVERAFNNNCVAGTTVLTGSCTVGMAYWSSTTWARSTGMAWYVGFPGGTLSPSDKASGHRVRAVRGGSSSPRGFPGHRADHVLRRGQERRHFGPVAVPDDGLIRAGAPLSFTDNGNGTITDNNTGLVWEKKSDDGSLLHDKDNIYWWSGNSVQETVWDWIEDVNSATFGVTRTGACRTRGAGASWTSKSVGGAGGVRHQLCARRHRPDRKLYVPIRLLDFDVRSRFQHIGMGSGQLRQLELGLQEQHVPCAGSAQRHAVITPGNRAAHRGRPDELQKRPAHAHGILSLSPA